MLLNTRDSFILKTKRQIIANFNLKPIKIFFYIYNGKITFLYFH